MALIGDTVRLVVRFRTFSGQAVDPTDVKLRVLDGESYVEISSVSMTDQDKVDVGVYEYDYIIPNVNNQLVYEFSGVHNDKPILTRGRLNVEFI